MRISIQAGVYSTFVGLAGAGAVIIWPDRIYFGYCLMGAAVAMLAWGIEIDGRHWWQRKRAAGNSWMPLHLIFRHLAFHSEWARHVILSEGESANALLQREFIEACARSELATFGRVQSVKAPHTLSAASEAIPNTFWTYAFVQPFAEIVQRDPSRGAASTLGKFYGVTPSQYREVSARTAEVMALWPKAKWRPFNRRPVAFTEALRSYWFDGRDDQSREFDDMVSMLTGG